MEGAPSDNLISWGTASAVTVLARKLALRGGARGRIDSLEPRGSEAVTVRASPRMETKTMILCTTSRVVLALALCSSVLTASQRTGPIERGQMSFPRLVRGEEGAPLDRPLWIDADETFTTWGEFRSPELAERMPGAAAMLERFKQALADGTYGGGDGCFEEETGMGALAHTPPMPNNMTDLEVLAEAIIYGRIVGFKPGFLRGRGFGLYEIEVLDVLKGTGAIQNTSSVFLFWPEAQFDFDDGCIQWALSGWPKPMPRVGAEILLTPLPGVMSTVAGRLAITAWYGAEAIYEADGGLRAPLPPMYFPELSIPGSLRELELVRRLRDKRR